MIAIQTPTHREVEAAREEFAALGASVVRSSPLTPDQRASLYADIENHGAYVRLNLDVALECRESAVAYRVRSAASHLVVAWSIYRRLLTSPTGGAS